MNKQLIIQGALFTIIGALTPIVALLTSDQELTNRVIAVMVISGLIAGATALKAYLSTTFADSPQSETSGRTARLLRKK